MNDPETHLNEELEKARNQIEQAHQEWIAALDAVEDPIFLHDKDFLVVRANRAYQRCAGIPFKEIIGRPYFEIFPKWDGPMPACRRTVENNEKEGNEEEINVGNRIYRSRAFPVHDEHGAFLYSVHSLEDVTERREMEASLKSANALIQSVIENAPVRIFWKDAELRYLGCNTAFARDAGFSAPEELIGKDDYQMGWREQADLYRADDKRVMDADTPKIGFDEPQTKPDGSKAWVRTSKVPMHDDAGNVNAVLGMYEDITEWKQSELNLRESEERYRTLFTSMLNGFAYCRMLFEGGRPVDFIYLDVNEAFERQTGLKDVIGKRVSEVIPGIRESDSLLIELYGRVAMGGSPEQFETYVEAMKMWFSISVYSPKAEHFVAVFDVITERKLHELTLQRSNRALRTISAGNEALIHATEEDQLLKDMCNVAVHVGGYHMALIGYARDDEGKTIERMAQTSIREESPVLLPLSWDKNRQIYCPAGRAIVSGKPEVVQDIQSDPEQNPWSENALRSGFNSCIALPLMDGDKAFGALVLFDDKKNIFNANEVKVLEEMSGDLAFGILTLRVKAAHREHEQRLQKNMLQTVEAIASIVEMRDPYTSGHQARVADIAKEIARQMGLDEEQMQAIHLAGLVHDLGKIRIPAEILSKPGRLNDVEYSLIKMHPQAGYDILKGVDFSWPIAQMVLQHHERMDGSGYPQGLKGDKILLGARILVVADVVEAMSSHRPYRPGLGNEAALQEIMRGRRTLYDAQVVDACVALFRERGYVLNV